jgi:CDP-glucose 4,6-dehydratase
MENMGRLRFWKGKRVLLTGHTGFKGMWMTIWLNRLGAEVTGYSLEESENDEFFDATGIGERINDIRADINDADALRWAFTEYRPQIVFHMAAQSLVGKSYDEPLSTVETNVMGTANVLEAMRLTTSVKSAVIVTSDKCYQNNEWVWGYRETDQKGGRDPYSASKGCAEVLVESYRNSFLRRQGKLVASARAGNAIGGGDWSRDRLIPDCIKALQNGRRIRIRNPDATRPWQHVLEPLDGYMMLAERMYTQRKYDEAWNFGPTLESIRPVAEVADLVIKEWGSGKWVDATKKRARHEARALALDISKAYFQLGWKPKLTLEQAVAWTVEWYRGEQRRGPGALCRQQIAKYERISRR